LIGRANTGGLRILLLLADEKTGKRGSEVIFSGKSSKDEILWVIKAEGRRVLVTNKQRPRTPTLSENIKLLVGRGEKGIFRRNKRGDN